MSQFLKRRKKMRGLLRKNKLDGILITNVQNVTYLSGFTGDSSYLLLTPQHEILLSDQRYTTQLEEECPDLELAIRGPGKTMLATIQEVTKKAKLKSLGFESSEVTVALYSSLRENLEKLEFVPTTGWVEELRMIKDSHEIARTRIACDQARRAFEVVRASLTPDMTELQIAADLEYQARRFGGKCLSFPPIVGVGPRAALPHGSPTSKQIHESDFTLIDWGVNEGLYVSDLTRILVTGKILPKLRKVYGVVLKAQLAAIDTIRPGVSCEEVDHAARKVIVDAGFGKHFGHGLGHGTGLDVHEAPRLSRGQETPLAADMIVTVEPGIYLPGWGGVRIEDDVLVTRDGHEVLSSVPKQLEECVVQ